MAEPGEKPNLVLIAEGESKQTISVRINNETLRQIHEILLDEKKRAKEAMMQEPTMTWVLEEILKAGLPVFRDRRNRRTT